MPSLSPIPPPSVHAPSPHDGCPCDTWLSSPRPRSLGCPFDAPLLCGRHPGAVRGEVGKGQEKRRGEAKRQRRAGVASTGGGCFSRRAFPLYCTFHTVHVHSTPCSCIGISPCTLCPVCSFLTNPWSCAWEQEPLTYLQLQQLQWYQPQQAPAFVRSPLLLHCSSS